MALTLFIVRVRKELFEKNLKFVKKVLDSLGKRVHKHTSRLERNKCALEVSSKRQGFGSQKFFGKVSLKKNFERKAGNRNLKKFWAESFSEAAKKVDTMQVDRLEVSGTGEGWNLEHGSSHKYLRNWTVCNKKLQTGFQRKLTQVYWNGSLIIEERNGIINEL